MPAWRRVLVAFLPLALLACVGGEQKSDTGSRPVTLSITVAGPGGVEVSGAASGTCDARCDFAIEPNVPLTLVPVAGASARFMGFSGGCTGVAACTFSPTADTSVTATFSAEPVRPEMVALDIARLGDGAGQVTSLPPGVTCSAMGCEGTFEIGSVVTLTAIPDSGSQFVGWEAGVCSGTGACELTLSAPTAVTARFARDQLPDRYVVTELTYADEDVRVRALDEDGNAVGCVGGSRVGSLSRPFLYDAATGALTLLPPEDRSACAIGLGGGTIAIDTWGSAGGTAYRFVDGSLHDLGSLGGESVSAADVNESGWIVGTATLPDERAHPFLHDGVTMRDLGATAPDVSAYAVAINSSGEVLAYDGRLFSAGAWIPLSLPANAHAADLSDAGVVVGTVALGGKASEGFIHDARTGVTTRVKSPDGRLRLSFRRVNRAGTRMLGTVSETAADSLEFVYGAGAFQWLPELLGRLDWFTSGEGVNNRGQIAVIVVDHDDMQSRVRSFILTPE